MVRRHIDDDELDRKIAENAQDGRPFGVGPRPIEQVSDHELGAEQAQAMLREWAKGVPAIADAALLGYDVTSAVLGLIVSGLADQLAAVLGPVIILTEGTLGYSDSQWLSRPSPFPIALHRREQAEEIASATPRPACVSISVSRVKRFWQHANADPRTACLVRIACVGVGERVIVVGCE